LRCHEQQPRVAAPHGLLPAVQAQSLWTLRTPAHQRCERGLTPRSSGHPTALRTGLAAFASLILCGQPGAQCRWVPLSSNVRLRKPPAPTLTPASSNIMLMRNLFCVLTSVVLVAACANANRRQPVTPFTTYLSTLPPLSSACKLLGSIDISTGQPLDYPRELRRIEQTGWVAVQFDVAAGQVVKPRVLKSSPPGAFDASALQYIAEKQFKSPGTAADCHAVLEYKLN
jgi:TonB family protein